MKIKTLVGIVVAIMLEGALFMSPFLIVSALVGIVTVYLADKYFKI